MGLRAAFKTEIAHVLGNLHVLWALERVDARMQVAETAALQGFALSRAANFALPRRAMDWCQRFG